MKKTPHYGENGGFTQTMGGAYKKSVGSNIFDIFNLLFMIIIVCVTLYPFWHVFAISISGAKQVEAGLINIIPKNISLRMYGLILSLKDVQKGYFNTILYAVTANLVALCMNMCYAYPMSKPHLKGKPVLTIYLAITMFINGGLIPTYLLIRSLGLYNTFLVMVLPGCVSAWAIIVMRTFFQQLPYELTESSMIDGAGELLILVKVILPLSKPIIATMMLFGLVSTWNSWFNAFIYLKDEWRWPIQLILRKISISGTIVDYNKAAQYVTQESGGLVTQFGRGDKLPLNYQYTMLMVTILPLAVAYPFFHKYFAKGILVGSIKG